jgi:sigma-B regulation protein RsbU (phosphoserine phosphatase)
MDPKDLSGMRVLVVDDTRANIDVLVGALRDDYKISVATSGPAALQAIARAAPDIVLLDIMMPDMDGFEVCRRIREDKATRDLPVLFLSALESTSDKVRAFEAGGNDYVTKPFQIEEVRARVHAQLAVRAYRKALEAAAAAELRVAGDIQRGILDEEAAAEAAGMGVDVRILFRPAREVGGDLFEVRRLDGNRLLLAVGDVSGKGVPASLFMAVATTLVRSVSRTESDPGRILSFVNDELARRNPLSMFVTLFLGVLDARDGVLRYALAGHPSPVSVRPGSPARPLREEIGTLAGVMPGLAFPTREHRLEPGEVVIAFTDGIPEAFGPGSALFGDERTLRSLSRVAAGSGSEAVVATLMADVTEFVAGTPASDDIAVVAFRLLPGGKRLDASWDVEAKPAAIMEVVEDVAARLLAGGADRADVDAVKLAVEETMSNVANHAYGGRGGRIRVTASLDASEIVVELRDDGPEFDPLRPAAPRAPAKDLDDVPIGGLGLELVRSMMSGLDWKREDGKVNRLRMVRRRAAAGGTAPR